VKTRTLLPFLLLALPLCAQTPSLENLKREAVAEVDSMSTLTQQIVDQVFSYSELGFQEVETSRYLTGLLEKNGFRVERGVAGIPTAWVATFGSGKPVIMFMTDIDCIPRASQKPGVAYHDPIVQDAPGHGEGHNSGQAVNITAALALKKLMLKYKLPGTIKIMPGDGRRIGGHQGLLRSRRTFQG
jgi:aminobenzoyl-glutamate utilization protein B